jgi:predicted ester cyclase
MANPQNEAVVRRSFDLLNQPHLPPDYEQLIDPNFENHSHPTTWGARGGLGFKGLHESLHAGLSDFSVTIEKMLSDGDLVAVHYRMRGTHTGGLMGVEPTGKTIDITGTGIYRCHDGKLAEAWVNPDMLGMLQQLGAVPAFGQAQQRAA